jgi:polyribonucleotide nucleotidyltransferase
MADALRFAAAAIDPILAPQLALLAARARGRRRPPPLLPVAPKLHAAVEELAFDASRALFGGGAAADGSSYDTGAGKAARGAAIARLQADVLSGLRHRGLLPDETGARAAGMFAEAEALRALDALQSRVMRDALLAGRCRADGRAADELRRVAAVAGPLPRVVHGSGLFERGDTQSLAAATVAPEREAVAADGGGVLSAAASGGGAPPSPAPASAATQSAAATTAAGDPSAAAKPPGAGGAGAGTKRLVLHYSFPPFCTGEVGKAGAPNRREIGHGALAEKALAPLMPDPEAFPFWARVVAETLGSSGSSSMAAVCSGALALKVAGVPLVDLAAGVSIGLAVERAPQIEVRLARSVHLCLCCCYCFELRSSSCDYGTSRGQLPSPAPILTSTDPRRKPPQLASEPPSGTSNSVYAAGGGASVDYGRHVLLTDIQGLEDHLLDMDYKVGGGGI